MQVKECWNCNGYKAYYTKGFNQFNKEDTGICTKKRKVVGKHETCEWFCGNCSIRNLREKVALKSLTDILQRLSELEQILREGRQDNG